MEPGLDWLARAARARPDRVAVDAPDGALTYGELAGRATGAPDGRLEAVPGLPFVIDLHACLRAGVPVVPLDPRLGDEERAARVAAERDLEAGPPALERPALVLFTSGTTAAPKRVVLTYGNLLWSALGSAVALGLDPDERWLLAMPLAHVGGLSVLVRSAIYGTSVVLHPRFDPSEVARALTEDAITIVSLVPTMLARVLDAGLERPPALRRVLLGGGPIPPALLDRAAAAGVPVAPTYGLTEACSQVATNGVPLPFTSVELSDAGEILVSGPTVSPSAGPVLRTGDLGSWDERGRLRVVGRLADTIVTGGENVAPAEVEAVLLAHPAVADAAVVGRPDPEWGERLVALLVAHDAERPPARDIRAHVAGTLASFKVPKEVEWRDELPRNAAGKLLRRDLDRP